MPARVIHQIREQVTVIGVLLSDCPDIPKAHCQRLRTAVKKLNELLNHLPTPYDECPPNCPLKQ